MTGVLPENCVTNAVTLADDLVITSNGGAGVPVALSNYGTNPLGLKFVTVLGRLDMPGTANFVASTSSSMFVADGEVGLQIIQIVLK